MKIYISCDMEGVGGVVSWKHVSSSHEEYQRFRKLMTAEANAAALGAFDAGAESVLVNDSHGGMTNIHIEDLDPRIELFSGAPKINSMAAGIDGSFSAVFLIGYHHGAGGLRSTLDHTYTGAIHQVTVNDIPLSEAGLFGGVAGRYGVPVVLVTGEEQGVRQTIDILGEMEAVVTKRAGSRTAAICRHPEVICTEIRAAAARACGIRKEPFTMEPPYVLQVEFDNASQADEAEVCPGSERVSGYRVMYRHDDYLEIIRAFRTFCHLAVR